MVSALKDIGKTDKPVVAVDASSYLSPKRRAMMIAKHASEEKKKEKPAAEEDLGEWA
jgi:broad specificity phosphatase PhoE